MGSDYKSAQSDGKTIKVEFNISNLTNDNVFPLGYCNGTKIVEKDSISQQVHLQLFRNNIISY